MSGTAVTISSSGTVTLYVVDGAGAYVTDLPIAEDGSADLSAVLVGGTNHLVLVDDTAGVMGPAGSATIWFEPDEDGDGATDAAYGGTDCDDTDAAVYPGATETCDGIDDDCDGAVDEPDAADAGTWYADADGDGYGDATVSTPACTQPSVYVADDSDCDDASAAVNPDATEACNGVDDDCSGTVDEPSAVDAAT